MNIAALKFFDNTRVNEFRTCPRKYYLRHVLHWTPESIQLPLVFGSSWHSACDVLWSNHSKLYSSGSEKVINEAYDAFVAKWVESGLPEPDKLDIDQISDMAPRTPMIAKEMIRAYPAARKHLFTDSSFELVAVEQPFAVPLDPNDPTYWYIGKLDKVFRYRKAYYIGEHKTSTAFKKGGPFRSDFIDSFSLNGQIDGYLFALRTLYGNEAAACWVDAALVHKEHHGQFKFIPVDRQGQMLDAFLWEVRCWIDSIEGNLDVLPERAKPGAPYLAAFPKNTASCGNYGGCKFADICRTIANPAAQNGPPLSYKLEPWDPLREIDLTKIGFDAAGKERA